MLLGLKRMAVLSRSCGWAFAQHESGNYAWCGWSIDDDISPFSLRTSDIGEEPYEVVSSSIWEENPEVDGPVILDGVWCTGINPRDTTAKENWNKSNHGHKFTKLLMTLLS